MVMQLLCSHCGASVPDSDRFCVVCGARMIPQAPVPAARTAAPAISATPGVVTAPGLTPVLAGRYTVERVVGRGGMSTVYRAYDTRFSNRLVAVKEMVDQFDTPEERAEAARDFARESDLLAELRHPGFPIVFDRFSANSRHYLVMEYIEGENLEKAVNARTTPYPEDQVRTWALELCSLLAYLHEQPQPVIFRDLKPGNILSEPSGRLRLVDFGIARFFKSSQTADTMPLGTSGYASPEHYTGQTDARSDIYSLGATLHHLLTLRDPSRQPPFQFPPVSSLNPAVSPELDAIVGRALTPDRALRFNTVREVEVALRARARAPRTRTAAPPAAGPMVAAPLVAQPGGGSGLVLVITRLRRGADIEALAREMGPLIGQPPATATDSLRRLPVVLPLIMPQAGAAALGRGLKRLQDLGSDARQVIPATESVNLSPTLQQELLAHHQIEIWDVTVGAGRTCYCRRCQHRWHTSKAVGGPVPQRCPQCNRADWSRRRLCKCAWCGHEFEVNDYHQDPERERFQCECCGLGGWLHGRRDGWQGLVRTFRGLLGLSG